MDYFGRALKALVLTFSFSSLLSLSGAYADECSDGGICTSDTPMEIIQANYLIGIEVVRDIHFSRFAERIDLTNPNSDVVGGRSQNRPRRSTCKLHIGYIPREERSSNNVIKAGSYIWFDSAGSAAPSMFLTQSYDLSNLEFPKFKNRISYAS